MGFLIIDIDNVVCNFVSAMIDFTNERLGTEYKASDVTVWDFVDSPNIDIEFDHMMSLLDDLPYSATATAKDLTKLVLITRHNFERLTEEHPILGVKMLKKIARLMSLRLRQTTGVLVDHLE